ncbi:MAG: hypothetical protein IIZ13_04280 [Renibacterium sp.]|nr:hypothetical protein [Renibacterium sp.]
MNGGAKRGRIPDWTPRSFAPVCLLSDIPALRELAAGIVTAAGTDLVDGLPAASAVSAVLIGPDLLAGVQGHRAMVERRTCPRILIGIADEGHPDLWQLAAKADIDHVVPLPEGAAWLAEFLNSLQSAPELGRTISIVGGHGGAGASTTAALLALRSAAAGHRTLLIDGDPWGPGIEYALSAEPAAGLTWSDLRQSSGTLSPIQFSAALPQSAGCDVLGFGRIRTGAGESAEPHGPGLASDVVLAALEAASRAFELVLVDVGRSAGTVELFAPQSDLLICQSTAGLTGLLAVRKLLPALPASTRLVVRRPFPEGLDAQLAADSAGLPLLGEFPLLRGVGRIADRGALPELVNHRGVRRLFGALSAALGTAAR